MTPIRLIASGGGTRGPVQLGALEFLRREGVAIREAVGVSAGAITVAGLASGRSPLRLMKLSQRIFPGIWDPRVVPFWPFADGASGLIRGKKILDLFRLYMPKDYRHCTFPVTIKTHDWTRRKGRFWQAGDLPLHVRASMSLPVFDMVDIGGNLHEDGGVTGAFPADFSWWTLPAPAPVLGLTFASAKTPRPAPRTRLERLCGTMDDMLAAFDKEAEEDAQRDGGVHLLKLQTSYPGFALELDPRDIQAMFDEGFAQAKEWWGTSSLRRALA